MQRRVCGWHRATAYGVNFFLMGTAPALEDLTSDLWMWGITPPPAMVALINVSSSSSPRMANCKWRGVIRFTFKSLHALPANSSTSAVKYSRMAEEYTAEVAPTRCWEATRCFKKR